MKPAVSGEDDRIIIVSDQFIHHLDARRASGLRSVFIEAQKAIPARRRVTPGFPGMNDAHQPVLIGVTAAVEPLVISLHLRVNLGKKFQVMTVLKYQMSGNSDQGRMRE